VGGAFSPVDNINQIIHSSYNCEPPPAPARASKTVQSHRERAEGSQRVSVSEAWQTGGRFIRIRAATAHLTAAPHPHSPSLEEARRARGCWRLATAPHRRAPRGAHAYRLRGAASRPLGRRPAASVRPTHGGAGHRSPYHRATPPQPLLR